MLLAVAVQVGAKKAPTTLSVDKEQQFLYYFYAARHTIEQEDFARALVLLDFCEQINPNDAVVNDHLGVIYSSLKQTDKAAAYFKKAYELAPTECSDHYLDYLLQAKQWKKAIKVQDNVDALNGFTANSALNRYQIFVGLNKHKQAVEAIDRYLDKDPESLNFLLFRADIHVHLGEDEQAFNLSQHIARLPDLSLQEFEMIKRVPYCAYYVSMIKTFEADSLMEVNQYARGYENYEIAAYLWPKNMTALNNYAYGLAIHGGDLSQAEKMSSTTIQTDPNNAVFLDTYAWILHLKGQDSLALFYLRKALENVKSPDVKIVVEQHINEIDH